MASFRSVANHGNKGRPFRSVSDLASKQREEENLILLFFMRMWTVLTFFWKETCFGMKAITLSWWKSFRCDVNSPYGKTTLVPCTWNLTEVNNIFANGTYHEVKWSRTTFCLIQFFLWLVWLEIHWYTSNSKDLNKYRCGDLGAWNCS